MNLIKFSDQSWVPDILIRMGIRHLSKKRLINEGVYDPQHSSQRYQSLLINLKKSIMAIDTEKANEQHYELPDTFFKTVLGKHLKYSACYFSEETNLLNDAEDHALRVSVARSELKDGQRILELGCGWGSLTIYMAKQFPNAKITAVSNSHSQRNHILHRLKEHDLNNVEVITKDVNNLTLEENEFDRVVSIEMFEHVRNYQVLFTNISHWLKPDGKLWCHVFCHRYLMYTFEEKTDEDWMSKYFFTGGIMPAYDTFLSFQRHLNIESRWFWSGKHYEKTANAWLKNMDASKQELMPLFEKIYGKESKVWWQRWRIFFMACAELFGYNNGTEWGVGHYLFENKK